MREIHLSDGQVIGPIHIRTITSRDLFVGMPVDAGSVDALLAAEDKRILRDAALAHLGYSARSAAELARYLTRKNASAAVHVQAVIDELIADGYLDDRALCERLVQQSAGQAVRESRQALKYRLSRRGIARDVIEQVLADEAEHDEYQGALQLGRKKLAEIDRKVARQLERWNGVESTDRDGRTDLGAAPADEELLTVRARRARQPDSLAADHKRRAGVAGYLARKGYAHDTIMRVLETLVP